MTNRLQPKPPYQEPEYRVPRAQAPIDLRLDGNEGPPPREGLLAALRDIQPSAVQQYPSTLRLESIIAETNGLRRPQVLVTAGADDAIQRLCRAFLGPECRLIMPTPTFGMIERFATWEGAQIVRVPWNEAPYPLEDVISAAGNEPAVIAMVSPNNPTGGWATPSDLIELSQRAPQALIMVDGAYAEFGTHDLTRTALGLPNAVILRTFSKAKGLAGLRVGYAMGDETWIKPMRSAGLPYPVGQPSLMMAERAYRDISDNSEYLHQVANERIELRALLQELGWNAYESQGNFVFAQGGDSVWLRDGMAAMGIGIRAWPDSPTLGDSIRITCPGNTRDFERLSRTLKQVGTPEAILFDMDGVLADVSQSYRQAIIETASHFGIQVSLEEIETLKQAGNANNDWVVTQRLLAAKDVSISLADIRRRFDSLYLGSEDKPGTVANESMLGTAEQLMELGGRFKLGVVTGRPRLEAEAFLERFGLRNLFPTVVTLEDAAPKPSPEPVRLALDKMNAKRAWMIGDTPDDIRAARSADVLPLGVTAPGADVQHSAQSLLNAGAARILNSWTDLLEVLR